MLTCLILGTKEERIFSGMKYRSDSLGTKLQDSGAGGKHVTIIPNICSNTKHAVPLPSRTTDAPVIQHAKEIIPALESHLAMPSRSIRVRLKRYHCLKANPLLDESKDLNVNGLSLIDALNKLFEWKKKFLI